jgi:hypothetical protein
VEVARGRGREKPKEKISQTKPPKRQAHSKERACQLGSNALGAIWTDPAYTLSRFGMQPPNPPYTNPAESREEPRSAFTRNVPKPFFSPKTHQIREVFLFLFLFFPVKNSEKEHKNTSFFFTSFILLFSLKKKRTIGY